MIIITTNLKYVNPLIPLDKNNVNYIVIHHIVAKNATPEDIHSWHLANGWSGFGYNEYIRKDGTVYIGRGDTIGAQCPGYNSKSYGIALEGNYDVETQVPQAQMLSLITRLRYHEARFNNLRRIIGHKELVQTSCPGHYFNMSKVLSALDNPVPIALDKLKAAGVIISPDYWLANALPGKLCNGEYVATLLINMASKV